MNTHLTIALTIAAILIILGAFVVLAGILKSAGKADAELEHIEPGDLMDPEPKFTRPQDHALARRLKDSIWTKLQGNG